MIPAKVLIVEDERIVAQHLRQRLSLLGYQVPAIATTGPQALEQINNFRPDLVLIDITLKVKLTASRPVRAFLPRCGYRSST